MISYNEIKQLGIQWGLREDIVEKDYCLGWLLKGIVEHPELNENWVFKGGTCIKKCYVETYRFSEDLDFTVLNEKYVDVINLQNIFKQIIFKLEQESGIKFTIREPVFRKNDFNPLYLEGKVYYIGPRNSPQPASIKLDLSASEKLIDKPLYNEISHPYSDNEMISPFKVKCYSFDELFAEKIRALGERCRPRDLYDVINLFRRSDYKKNREKIYDLLRQKCKNKEIQMITFETIENSQFKEELISEWKNMLGHQLPVLPPFNDFWQELPRLFNWLERKEELKTLPIIPQRENEIIPSISVFTSAPEKYYGFSLEAIRFAAVNRLYVKLGYDNTYRLIEPYSLRTTKDGNILLCAVKENGETRTYRIDRIQSVEITDKSFNPRFLIEFPPAGRVNAPLLQKESKTSSDTEYIYKCIRCGKQFIRKNENSKLNSHKDKYGNICYGTYGKLIKKKYI